MTPFPDLSPPYRTLVVDPPWPYPIIARTKCEARRRYTTMSLDELADLPVAELADSDGAHLWCWATNAFLEDAYRLVRAWGFRPLNLLTWCKDGPPGVGYYLRTNTEHAIFAVRGAAMVPEVAAMSSWHVWPRRGHSVKPPEFCDLVEQVSPGPYVELFCRQQRLGWHGWGWGVETGRAAG